jgi:hypothetical protein
VAGGKVAEHGAVVVVHHDADEVAGLAEHQVAALRRNLAEEPRRDPVVELHVVGVGRVDAERRVAVAAVIGAHEHGIGKFERLPRKLVDLGAHQGGHRGVNRRNHQPRVKPQETQLGDRGVERAARQPAGDPVVVGRNLAERERRVVQVHERVDGFAVAHQHGLRLLLLHRRAEQAGPARGDARLHAVGQKVGENLVGVDRTAVAELLGELAGLRGELAHALAELAHPLGELGGLLLHLGALGALDLDLLFGLGQVLADQLFLLLGHAHGDIEILDALARLGVLALHAGELGLLALGLGALLLQLALELGQLFLREEGLLRGGAEALLELAHVGLGRGERALELALLLLERGEVLLALGERALGGRELGGELLTRGFLVLQ